VKIRNCAWLSKGDAASARAVWARGKLISRECPKSVISAQSLAFLEMFQIWRSLGKGCDTAMNAREAEAIELLEREYMAEDQHGS
jgi:hypothetical protein